MSYRTYALNVWAKPPYWPFVDDLFNRLLVADVAFVLRETLNLTFTVYDSDRDVIAFASTAKFKLMIKDPEDLDGDALATSTNLTSTSAELALGIVKMGSVSLNTAEMIAFISTDPWKAAYFELVEMDSAGTTEMRTLLHTKVKVEHDVITGNEGSPTYANRQNNLVATVDPTATDDSDSGYGYFSVWFNTTTETAWVCKDATVDAAVWEEIAELSNWTALVAPTATDDVDAGYSVGSCWYDTVLGVLWTCCDNTADAAVWKSTSLTAADMASIIHAATAKGSLAANDEIAIVDSAAANGLKKVLWSVISALFEAAGSIAAHAGLTTGVHGLGTASQEDVSAFDAAGAAATAVANQNFGDHADQLDQAPTDGQVWMWDEDTSQYILTGIDPSSAGTGSPLFLDDTPSGVSTYQSLLTYPAGGAEEEDSAVANSGTGEVLIEAYSTPSALGVTTIPAGEWDFHMFCRVSASAGVSEIVVRVYKRTSGGVETELFNTTTGEINATAITAYDWAVVEPEFTLLTTDRLVVKFFAKSDSVSNRTLYLTHNGTAHYSHFHYPKLVDHNDLPGRSASDAHPVAAITGALSEPASSAHGDILFRNASGWTRLPAGTADYYLQTKGAGVDPVWAMINTSVYVLKAGDTMTGALVIDMASDAIPLTIDGVAGQTADLQRWNVATVQKAFIDSNGSAYFSRNPTTGVAVLTGATQDTLVCIQNGANGYGGIVLCNKDNGVTTITQGASLTLNGYRNTYPGYFALVGGVVPTGNTAYQCSIVAGRSARNDFNGADLYIDTGMSGFSGLGATSRSGNMYIRCGKATAAHGSVKICVNDTTTAVVEVTGDGKLGFYAATPVVKQTAAGASGYSAVAGTGVTDTGTFTGGVGATAYTIGDIVAALKTYGLLTV